MKCSKKRKKKKKKHKTACQHFNCKPCSWIIKSERQDCAYGCLFISPYGAELCAAFLHLHRHPGRHQNALLILAAPRHKSASGKTDPKMHRENTRAATTRGALRFSAEFAPQKGGCLFFFLNGANKKKQKLEGKMEFVMCLSRDLTQDAYQTCRAAAAVRVGGGEGAHGGRLGVCFFRGWMWGSWGESGAPQMYSNLPTAHPSHFYLLHGTPKALGLV